MRMKKKFFILTSLIFFIVFFAAVSLNYLSKSKNDDTELTYITGVSEVKYNNASNTALLSSVLQTGVSKEKETIDAEKEKNQQPKKEEVSTPSEKNNTVSQNNNTSSQQQNTGGTIIDNLRTIGSNNQVILVTGGYGTSTARIRTFERINGKFSEVMDVPGYIGKYGFAEVMSEGGMRSPRGKFSIGTAFGRSGNPGTSLSFRNITDNDFWVDDPNSPLYNTWQTGPVNGRWNSAEKMNIAAYNYGFVINYNTDRVPGLGSAIFFHVSSSYTAGCTGTSQGNVIEILKWLDPAKNPVIIQCPESELGNY